MMTFNRDFEIFILLSFLVLVFVGSMFWAPKKEKERSFSLISFFTDIENIIIISLFIVTFFGGWYLSIKNELIYNKTLVQSTWAKYELELDRQGRVVSKLLDATHPLQTSMNSQTYQNAHNELTKVHQDFLNERSTQNKIILSMKLHKTCMNYLDELNSHFLTQLKELSEDQSHYASVVFDLQEDIDIAFNRFKHNIKTHNQYFKKRFVSFVAKQSKIEPINPLTMTYEGSKLTFTR